MPAALLPAKSAPKDRQAHARDPMLCHRRNINTKFVNLVNGLRWQRAIFDRESDASVRAQMEGKDPSAHRAAGGEALKELDRLGRKYDQVRALALREGAI